MPQHLSLSAVRPRMYLTSGGRFRDGFQDCGLHLHGLGEAAARGGASQELGTFLRHTGHDCNDAEPTNRVAFG